MAHILIVEDEDNIAVALEFLLTRAGHSHRRLATGAGALDEMRLNRPDLVLLDIYLPDMSGLDILAQVKADDHLRRVPVIVLTTTDDKAEIQRCYELGCNVYVTKPVDFEGFIEAIKQIDHFFVSVVQLPTHRAE